MIRKNNLKKCLYSLCASVGFLSAVFAPLTPAAVTGEGIFSAPELVISAASPSDDRVSAEKFTDIPENAWYYQYVDLLVGSGIINGISETEYNPGGTFTVAECAAVITRYLGLDSYAEKCRKTLIANGVPGAQEWYSGYMQALFDTGVIRDGEYGISVNADRLAAINNAGSAECLCVQPLERYQFAVLITRSFDIKTDVVSAKNIYPEICSNANSFIVGGKYDDTVGRYAENITDYGIIPEGAREDVLKAYYNGIFNGDETGAFNPYARLTRAEMSKVIAVVTSPDLRARYEYREINDVCRIPDDKFITDGWKEKTLDRNYALLILQQAALGISASTGGAEYLPFTAPEGYIMDVRFYQQSASVYKEIEKVDIAESQPVSVSGTGLRIMLVLRNSADAKVEGALRVDVMSDGSMKFDNLFKPVLQ